VATTPPGGNDNNDNNNNNNADKVTKTTVKITQDIEFDCR